MMKSYTSFIVLIGLFVLLNNVQSYAQGLTCQTSTALCDDITPYPAGTTGATAPAGNNYDCLLSQPDPVFFNITIGQAGSIQFNLQNSAVVDVDFILWGPFTDLLAAEAACGNLGNGGAGGNVIDCSYDPQAFETVDIANAQPGEVYIMMVTNYSNAPTDIFSTPNTGTGTIVCPCDIYPTFSETPVASNSGVMVDTSNGAAEFRVCPNDTLSFTIAFGADQIVDSLGINTGAITIGNAFDPSEYNIYGPFYPNAPLFDSMEYIVEIIVDNDDIGIHQFNLSTINVGPGSTCFDTYPITVIVPGIGDIPERDTICSGQDYQVIADVFVATNGGTSTYSWTQISGPAATINPNNTVFNPTFSPMAAVGGDSMSFQLEYTYGTCSQFDTIQLFFYDIDINMAAAPNPVCAGDPSNLTAILTDTIGESTTVVCDAYNGILIPHSPVPGVGTLPPFTDLDEGITAALPIGFNFNFYCNNYTQFYIHANGYITFTNYTGTTSWQTQFIPDATTPNNLIAGAWTDLDLNKGGTVDYFTTGTSPNQRLIVNFNNVATYSYDGFFNTDVVDFQIIVHETTNIVEIHATDVQPDAFGSLTLGMENDNGTLAIDPGVNQLTVPLLPNQAIRFSPATITTGSPVTYSWSPSNTLTDPTIFNPVANPTAPTTYVVTITNGACAFTDSIAVDITGSLPAPTVSCGTITQTSIQFDWTALTLPAGGFYEYSTDGGMTWISVGTNLSATLNSLSPNQTVNILVRGNDNLGTNCSPGAQGAVSCTTLPCSLVATFDSVQTVNCFGGSDGAVFITTTGGSPTLNYNWSNGATTEDITGLIAGSYAVTVTDGLGCTATSGPHLVAQPAKALLTSIDSSQNVSCNGFTDGAIYIGTSGGTGSYIYNWSNGATTEDIVGIAANNYFVTVTDANGCIITDGPYTIIEPTILTITLNNIDSASCNGANDGAVNVSVAGGTSNYNYLWSNGQTTQNATGLIAGNYSITVSDNNGCTATSGPHTVLEPTALSITLDNIDSATCGGANGAIYISASGGTGTLTYNWSDGQTTQDASGLVVGNYSITVLDANGCSITSGPYAVMESTALTVTLDSTDNVSCNGANDGAIYITATGGTGTLTYNWSNGQTTQDVNGLAANNYSVTVIDANGCSVISGPHTVTEPTALSITLDSTDNISCNGANDGAIFITATGGTGTLTYNWSNGQTTQDASGLIAGNYSVTVLDANGCSITSGPHTVTEPTALSITLDSTDNISCNGANDGAIFITATGGTGTLTYNWSNGQTTQDASGLIAGNYSVTVLDANGCSITSGPHTVTEPTALSITLDSTDNISCNGVNDGAIFITATGGTGTLTYNWSDGQTTQDASGLIAANYSVTVLDANGCSITSGPHTVTEPTALSITLDSTDNISCNGANDGAIYITAMGGTGTLTYNWSDGQTTQDASGLIAANYSVTVLDANGCSITSGPHTVTEPTALSITLDSTDNISCNGANDGAIFITATGGTGTLTYNWSDGQTTQDASGLIAANYSVTVLDANGCSITSGPHNVSEPTALAITQDSTDNVSCNGVNDGAIFITATGGTGTLTYNWSDGQTTQDASGLIAGNYSVTVLDANGCSITSGPHTLTEPTALAITQDSTDNVSCNGANDGAIFITATGGTGTLTYNWSDGQTTQDASGLIAANYSITVLDANGCSITSGPHNVSEPTALTITQDSTDNVSCNGANDGAIFITATGGTGTLTYNWSDGQTTQDASGLIAGNYSVTVLDANGCSITSGPHTVTEPTALAITQDSTTAPSCNGTSDGAIYISATGGTTAYRFEWSTGATTEDLVNIASGTYTVTLTDANNCEQTFTTSINQPGAVSLSLDATVNVDCAGNSNGSVSITAAGGNPTYSFIWNNGATDEDLTGLAGGTYTCTVADQNSCTDTLSVVITEPTTLSASLDSTHNVSCGGSNDGTAFISVSGGTGTYTFAWSNSATTEDITALSVGTYIVTVTDQNNCTDTVSATVGSASGITISDNTTNATCNGNTDGSINLTVNGGTPGYTYLWSNNATTQNISGLSAGTYTVTVTDNVGCAIPYTATTITAPSAITVSLVSSSDPTCGAGNDGSIDVSVSGGTGTYTFAWSNGGTSQNIFGLEGGTYNVTATDANNCVGNTSVTLNAASGIAIQVNTITGILGCDLTSIGELQAVATPADTSITYLWDNGSTTATINSLAAGTYAVTATTGTGCTATDSGTIIAPVVPLVNAFVNNQGTIDTLVNWNDEIMLHSGNNQSAQGVTYSWTFTGPTIGNLGINTPDSSSTTALPTEDGLYNIVLTATATTNGVVCTDQDSLNVTVKAKFQGVPTAFTPNNDKENDLFRPIGLDASDIIEFKVYNRWGQVVYNGDDLPNAGWDGTFNNVEQPRDVYIYILRFKQTGDDEETKMRGSVTLIR